MNVVLNGLVIEIHNLNVFSPWNFRPKMYLYLQIGSDANGKLNQGCHKWVSFILILPGSQLTG